MPFALQVSSLTELFGWVQLVLTNLGVWSTLGYVVQAFLIITGTTIFLKVVRGGG